MTVDGGGWTLVQRTVWDPAKTAALFTGYADWYGKTIGTPALGEGYRLAGRLWLPPALAARWLGAHETTLAVLDALLARLHQARAAASSRCARVWARISSSCASRAAR